MSNIKKIRLEKGVSQKELAEKAGVSQPFIHDLENENRNAKPETMERIAAALDCSVDDLRGEKTA